MNRPKGFAGICDSASLSDIVCFCRPRHNEFAGSISPTEMSAVSIAIQRRNPEIQGGLVPSTPSDENHYVLSQKKSVGVCAAQLTCTAPPRAQKYTIEDPV